MKNRFIFSDLVLSYYGVDSVGLENLEQTARHLKICEILSKHIAGYKQEINVPRFKKLKKDNNRTVTSRDKNNQLEDVDCLRYLKVHGKLEKFENKMTVI